MPRSHGRIMSTIWTDPDFIHLDAGPQRLYLFLLSQPDLSHAGLVPMRARRWAKKVGSYTVKDVERDMSTLEDARFIVTDKETEEVLVRTFVRNDGVYKQPKVMSRMREDARLIESQRLRAEFRAELDRLPLDELSDEPSTRGGQSTRQQVERVVDTLRSDFADALEYPSERVSGRVSDTPRVRAGAFPLPPSPVPHKDTPASAAAERVRDTFDAFWEVYPKKRDKGHAFKAYRSALKKASADEILEGLRRQLPMLRQAEDRFRPYAATWLNGERWADDDAEAVGDDTYPPFPVNGTEAEQDEWVRNKPLPTDGAYYGGSAR